MTDVLDDQPVFRFNQREGVLVGFRTRSICRGLTSPGITSTLLPMTAKAAVTCWITSSTTGCSTFGEIHKLMIDLPTARSCRLICIPIISMPPSVP